MKRKGFTLIELLIVIAIIGILASVAIPQMLKARTKAKCSGVEKNFTSTASELANELDSVERGARKGCAAATCQQAIDNVMWRHCGALAGCTKTYANVFCSADPDPAGGTEPNPFTTTEGGWADNAAVPTGELPEGIPDGKVYFDCANDGAVCTDPASCAVYMGFNITPERACGYSDRKGSLVTTKD